MRESSCRQIEPRCHLYVCTSCREKGFPREPAENRAGYRLYNALKVSWRPAPQESGRGETDTLPQHLSASLRHRSVLKWIMDLSLR